MLEELTRLSRYFLKSRNSPYRRYLIRETPFRHRLTLLLGPRGVGKTTTLIQHLIDSAEQDPLSPTILYIQADHFALGTHSLYEIAEHFVLYGGKVLAFDEIHKYPNWSQELKSIYDTFPDLHLLASGSSALQMYRGSHDLARRAVQRKMVGLSFREYLELKHNMELPCWKLSQILLNHERLIDELLELCKVNQLKVLASFKHYLRSGYYPYFLELPDESSYAITLEQNLHATIEVDLVSVHPHLSGASLAKLKQLLLFISRSVPFTPNWSKIAQDLGIGDIRTLKTYFHYLEEAFLIRSVGSASKKLSQVKNAEKVYLDNPNQLSALSLGREETGTVRELFFLTMLSQGHKVSLPSNGDFLIDDSLLFEVGGRNKSFRQISNEEQGFLACDEIERGVGKKIPLWLFGFLY